MRFQKTNFSDYLKAPEPVSPEPELTAAPEGPDLLDAESVAEQLESLLAARRNADTEAPATAAPSRPSEPANPAYDLLPPSRGRRRRTRSF